MVERAEQLRLAAVPSAVKWAGWFVHNTLLKWNVLTCKDQAAAVAAQLASIAIQASRLSGQLVTISVGVRQLDEAIFIEVWDCTWAAPLPRQGVLQGKRLGYYQASWGGRVAWCEVTGTSWSERADTATLERVLAGLHRLDETDSSSTPGA